MSKILSCTRTFVNQIIHVASTKAGQVRCSSYKSSPFLCDLDTPNIKYEKTKDPVDWQYVEWLLPKKTVPNYVPKTEYPSGWVPPSSEGLKQPYFVCRSRNHMLPVYMVAKYRGTRRLTYIKHVQGDIWLMEREIKHFLQKQQTRPIASQVNEFCGYICFYGDHVNAIKYWLLQRKF